MFDDHVEQMQYTDNILNLVKYRLHVWIRDRVDEVEEQGGQGRRGVLRTSSGEDRRPKCQPVGAQIDCRWEDAGCRWRCSDDMTMQVRPLPHAAGGRLVRALVLRGHRGGGHPGPLAVRLLVLASQLPGDLSNIWGHIVSSFSFSCERKPKPVLISVLCE